MRTATDDRLRERQRDLFAVSRWDDVVGAIEALITTYQGTYSAGERDRAKLRAIAAILEADLRD
jgi:hypothetical protein